MDVRFLIFVWVLSFNTSCSALQEEKFDRNRWLIKEDIEFPYRNRMLSDLIRNHKLVGLDYRQVVDLLGEPNFGDSGRFAYDIVEDYGFDIDPVYTKSLQFLLDKDSSVISYEIVEWEK